jgi:diguanylate cyclase (GGDEF)-like protein
MEMKTNPDVESSDGAAPVKSLTTVLDQNEHVEDLVVECAAELSSINVALKQEFAEQAPPPLVESALEKSEAVENKVQEVAAKLSVVNEALHDEVKERHLLEDLLAEVTGQEEAARHSALHDALTGLPNRKLAMDRLEHGLAQARRHERSLAVMFMDLNDFKPINDTHGHEAGDRVLQTIAARLLENTRDDDTVSRLGGDEFLYLMMETQSDQDVGQIAQKIVDAISQPCEVTGSGGSITLNLRVSIGIALFPQDGDSADSLVKSADTAMYRAKRDKSGYSYAQ